MLSDSLEEIGKLSSKKAKNSNETEIEPLYTFAQEEQLQKCIDKLENMSNTNDVIIYKNYKF